MKVQLISRKARLTDTALISRETSNLLGTDQSPRIQRIAFLAQNAGLLGEVINSAKWVFGQTVALVDVEVCGTRCARSRAEVKVSDTNKIGVENVVEVASSTSSIIKSIEVAVDII